MLQALEMLLLVVYATMFQWAPTLGGECYVQTDVVNLLLDAVSMGTHPWGEA